MKNIPIILALLVGSSALFAQNKVYVATFGNDANVCTTMSQPCKTWNSAISKASVNGNVFALDSGDFGVMNINAPIIIDGGAHGAFATGNFQIISISLGVSAGGPVVLRNISVVISPSQENNEMDIGIFASLHSGSLILDHVSVNAVPGSSQTTQGIFILAGSGLPIDLQDITISGLNRGIDIANLDAVPSGPTTAALRNVSVYASDLALDALETKVTIRNSSFRGRSLGSTGINLFGPITMPVSLLDSSQIASHITGIAVNAGTLHMFNNVISGNITGVKTSAGGTAISFRNNAFAGNGTDGAITLSTSLK